MELVTSPTEITTSATDLVLVIECIVIGAYLWRTPAGDRWRIGLWCWAYAFLAIGSALGVVTHGFAMTDSLRVALKKPLYLALGFVVALFLAGSLYDLLGRTTAKRLLPWCIASGVGFFALTQFVHGGFIFFVIYEGVVMATALAIYSFLAVTHRLNGAGAVAVGILLNLVAVGFQASHLTVNLLVPFNHDGLFHLVQMVALIALGVGLRTGMTKQVQS